MLVSGAGISGSVELKVKPKFKVKNDYGFSLKELSSANFYVVDRGQNTDKISCNLKTYGNYAYMSSLIDAIQDNRIEDNILTLTDFAADETIFGENIDYSSTVTATVTKLSLIEKKSLQGYGLKLTLAMQSCTHTGSSSMPDLNYLDNKYSADMGFTVNKIPYMSGSMVYNDKYIDAGIFKGNFKMTPSEVQQLQEFYRTNRGAPQSLSAFGGLTYMFGARSSNGFPVSCILTEYKIGNKIGLSFYDVKLTFKEVLL